MTMSKGLLFAAALALAATPALADGQYDTGASDTEIKIGNTNPYSGPASSYGTIGKALSAYFDMINEQGGINGRKINFNMVDDKYEPPRTASIVKRFVERDKCFALVAPLGSAPTSAVIDYVVENKMPLIGAGTGADKNLYIKSRYVFPLYPAYDIEGMELVKFAKNTLKATKIALLYQNDPSGKAHLKGINAVLKQHGVELVAAEGYEPKEIDVSSQVIKMKNSGADAVICSCAPEPAAKFYTERAKHGWKVPVVNVFFGKSPKVPELAGKEAVEGVYFATIFREWTDPAPTIQEAKKILKKYYPEEDPDAVHLWGFAGAQVFTEALKRMGKGPITREKLLDTLETIKDWKGSVVPVVNIAKMAADDPATKHLIVSEMSYVQYKGGEFKPFNP